MQLIKHCVYMDHNIHALRYVLFISVMRIHWIMQQPKMYNVVPD